MIISLIAAVDSKNGIGLNGKMPWGYIKADMEFFRGLTTGSTVIMGRVTFESLNKKPLPNRKNIVLASTVSLKDFDKYNNLYHDTSLESALSRFSNEERIFIIGGESVYKKAIDYANAIYLTHIDKDYKCDRFFPNIDENIFRKEELINFEHNSIDVKICRYARIL